MAKNSNNHQSEPAVYNIKAVVTQTGLNPATIRAWERRYGLPNPQRSKGGHRQYSQRDVDILKWLIDKQDEGMSISHAVELWQSLMVDGQHPLATSTAEDTISRSAEVPVLGKQIDDLRAAWIEACLQFDRASAESLLTYAFSIFPPEVVCLEILQKGLVEVGNRWHEGAVTVQQEHFTTALTEQRLEILIAAVPPPTRPERIVVTAAPGERHTFGNQLLTYLLRRQGWDIVHLGADVPVENFGPTIESLQPQLVIISAQLFSTAAAVKDVAQSTGVMLAYGGRIFNLVPKIRQYIPGFFLGETLEDAVKTTTRLLSTRPKLPKTITQDKTHQEALAQFAERRSLIESDVWDSLTRSHISTQYLAAINEDFSRTITAALKLGDIGLLGTSPGQVEELLLTYHQPGSYIQKYLDAYYRSARRRLNGSAQLLVDWLDTVAGNHYVSA